MVFFLLLGLADVIAGVLMLLTHMGILNEWRIAVMAVVYLVAKGVLLRGSFLSILDVLAGIYFVLIMLGLRTFLVYVFLAVFVYKFVVSLIMRGQG